MSALKPHTLRCEIHGRLVDWIIDCPYDPADQTKPCDVSVDDADESPSGCALIDVLGDCGIGDVLPRSGDIGSIPALVDPCRDGEWWTIVPHVDTES